MRTGTARGDGAAAHLRRRRGPWPAAWAHGASLTTDTAAASYARELRHLSARGTRSRYYERGPRRSKTKSALMIAGAAATGAGVGGAIKGKKGALIGAAIGGGGASIYEAAKRRYNRLEG